MKERPVITALILIVLVGSFLRFYRLGAKDLWFDEVYEAYLAKGAVSVSELVHVHSNNVFDNNPPLSHILRYFSYKIDTNEYYARLPSAVFAILTLFLSFSFGRFLFNETVGLIGAFLLCVSYFHIYYSQEARSYTLYTFLSLASLYLLTRILFSPEKKRGCWALYCITTTLLFYTHYYSFLVISLQILTVLSLKMYNKKNKEKSSLPPIPLLPFAKTLAIALFLFSPWIPTFFYHFTRVKSIVLYSHTTIINSLTHSITQILGIHSIGIYAYLFFFIFGCMRCYKKNVPASIILIIWSVLPFPLALVILMVTKHFSSRYFIFLLPIFLTACAFGIGEVISIIQKYCGDIRKGKKQAIYVFTFLLFLSLLVNFSGLFRYYNTQKWALTDIVSYLSGKVLPDDMIVAETYIKPPLLYYMSHKEIYDDPVFLLLNRKKVMVGSNDIISDIETLWKKRRIFYITDKKKPPPWVTSELTKVVEFDGLISTIFVYVNRP